jgi:hypothetical protein
MENGTMAIRTISSREIDEAFDDVAAGDLWKWRSNGYMEGLGEKVGTRFLFSEDEALKIRVAVALAKAGMGLPAAFEAMRNPTPQISDALAGRGDPLVLWPRRDHPDETAGVVKIVIDVAGLVRDAALRLAAARQRARNPRRRLSFAPRTVSDYRA